MGKRRTWTDGADAAALEAALDAVVGGVGVLRAASLTGVPASTIRLRFRQRGLVRRVEPRLGRPPLPAAVVRPALDAVARGVRVDDAAAAAGMAASTLRQWMLAEGVVMLRPRTPRPTALTVPEREEIMVG